jgi:cysteinyl-tRNA synthetase
MAKSTGNNILREILTGENSILSKAFPASVARFFMLQAHYRSILDFLMMMLLLQPKRIQKTNGGSSHVKTAKRKASALDIATWKQSCYDAMNDDFNSLF